LAELSVSDHGQLGSLAEYPRLAVPGVRVTPSAGSAGAGEQGALDVLMIVAESNVLVAVVKVLPEFLRSHKPGVSVTVTVRGERRQLTVTANDAGDLAPVIEKFFDD
jgi:Effector Associated Constant Component 1